MHAQRLKNLPRTRIFLSFGKFGSLDGLAMIGESYRLIGQQLSSAVKAGQSAIRKQIQSNLFLARDDWRVMPSDWTVNVVCCPSWLISNQSSNAVKSIVSAGHNNQVRVYPLK